MTPSAMASISNSAEQFAQAATDWDLKRLYKDLASAKQDVSSKRKGLTEQEQLRLCGLLCGYSPAEIAKKIHVSAGWLRAALSETVYRYVEKLTDHPTQSVKNWRDISDWLEAAGYKNQPAESVEVLTNLEVNTFETRFLKAIAQFNDNDGDHLIRVGKILVLDGIAKDFPEDHWRILEFLSVFIRGKCILKEQEEKSIRVSSDIQAALTLIGQLDLKKHASNYKLNLSNTDLSEANLNQANLEGVYFCEVNLQRANLWRANLQKAKLFGAKLQEVSLSEANLKAAYLTGTNLERAALNGANLEGANLWKAKLQEATFHGANLQGADLRKAMVQRANFNEAYLKEVDFREAKLQGVTFDGANLQGARLYEANLRGADFRQAEQLEAWQIELAYTDRTTLLPDYLSNIKTLDDL